MSVNKAVVTEVLVFGLGLSIGGGTAYILTKRKYEKQLEADIQSVKETYDRRYKSGEFATPGKVLENIRELEEEREQITEQLDEFSQEIADLGYNTGAVEEEREEPVIVIESEARIIPEELSMPDNMDPHVISYDSFMGDDYDHFDKISITYFQEDDTLMDEREEVIPDIENLLGADTTSRFGELSQDPDQVYVRVGKLRSDYEVTRDKRSYQEVVLGLNPNTGLQIGSRADD